MKSILDRLFHHPDTVPLMLFLIVFAVYFSSSVGIINSGDAPQYYTAEALIQYHNVNMKPFSDEPHYFVWPDFITQHGQVLSFRGFMQSLLIVPLHLIAPLITPFVSTNNFPLYVQIGNFVYELTVISLFTVLSAMGVLLAWKVMRDVGGSRLLAFAVSLVFAFGTFVWKYSAYYSRQGIILFLSGIILYLVWNILNRKGLGWSYAALSLCWGIAFGLDSIFFLSIGAGALLLMGLHVKRNGKKAFPFIALHSLPGMMIILITLALDIYWYGNLSPNQYLRSSQFDGIPMNERARILVSAPLFPTLFTLLFSFGPPLKSAFSHLANLPRHTLEYSSVAFAKQYNFYGLFAVSPFLLFAFAFPFWKLPRKTLLFYGFCILFFILNVSGSAKFYTFWGGNQYDIRYIYPSAIFLLPPLIMSLQYALRPARNLIYRFFYFCFFIAASIFSLFMGWLGEINMFAPAIGAERKIWIDPVQFPRMYSWFTGDDYIMSTFMNRENILIPVWLTGIGYLLFFAARIIYNATRNEANENKDGKTQVATGKKHSDKKKGRGFRRSI